MNKKIIIAGLVVVSVIAVLVVIVCFTMGSSIDLNDYLEIEFEGYNGRAELECRRDIEKAAETFAKEVGVTDASTIRDIKKKFDDIMDDIIVSKDDDLSNGDTITISWDISKKSMDKLKELEEEYGCKINHDDMKVTVSGLKDKK